MSVSAYLEEPDVALNFSLNHFQLQGWYNGVYHVCCVLQALIVTMWTRSHLLLFEHPEVELQRRLLFMQTRDGGKGKSAR